MTGLKKQQAAPKTVINANTASRFWKKYLSKWNNPPLLSFPLY